MRVLQVMATILGAIGVLWSTPLLAQDQGAETAPIVIQGDRFYWNDVGGTGPISIVVSVGQQVAYVYRGDSLIGISAVSTGKPGHETPLGDFTILQKEVDHHSNLYDDASMPFMERLTWDGVALHAGKVVNRPASHGCVRLPLGFARKLYGVTDVGAVVTITDEAIGSPSQDPVVMSETTQAEDNR
jgi:lipoprotein-anchoring transpeptidase ErfK/SrfK